MTANDDLERRIADFYATEAPTRAPDWVLASTLATVDTTRQRRAAIALPWRFPHMNVYAKAAVAIVAVVAVAAIGVAFLRPGSTSGVGQVPTTRPSSTILPSLPPEGGAMAPGTHTLGPGFPVRITLDVPAGWGGCSASPVEQGACSQSGNPQPGGVSFSIIDNVVADPCGTALKSPPVGPSVDDLVAAISGLDGFQATTAVDITLDGYQGKGFDVTAPAGSTCELRTWATADRTNGVSAGEVNVVRIFDVGGVRVMAAGAYQPVFGGPNARAQVEQVLDSVHIGG
jgi:hypothetical protein